MAISCRMSRSREYQVQVSVVSRVDAVHPSGDPWSLNLILLSNSSESHALGKNTWSHLHAGWEAEFLHFPLHLDPANGSLTYGPDEGRGLDDWSKGPGNRSPVWSDFRDTQPPGVDFRSPGILAWEKAQRGVEIKCWGRVSGRHLQSAWFRSAFCHPTNWIRRL